MLPAAARPAESVSVASAQADFTGTEPSQAALAGLSSTGPVAVESPLMTGCQPAMGAAQSSLPEGDVAESSRQTLPPGVTRDSVHLLESMGFTRDHVIGWLCARTPSSAAPSLIQV